MFTEIDLQVIAKLIQSELIKDGVRDIHAIRISHKVADALPEIYERTHSTTDRYL